MRKPKKQIQTMQRLLLEQYEAFEAYLTEQQISLEKNSCEK